eukprot:scaffold1127_cov361-Prasinococcus_capsulatus_cf.AAC.20
MVTLARTDERRGSCGAWTTRPKTSQNWYGSGTPSLRRNVLSMSGLLSSGIHIVPVAAPRSLAKTLGPRPRARKYCSASPSTPARCRGARAHPVAPTCLYMYVQPEAEEEGGGAGGDDVEGDAARTGPSPAAAQTDAGEDHEGDMDSGLVVVVVRVEEA